MKYPPMDILKFIKTLLADNELTHELESETGAFLRANSPTPKFYSNALRHIYASAVFTQMYGENVSHLYGIMNEMLPLSGLGDMKIDLTNNEIGREYGIKYPTTDRQTLLKIIFEDLKSGKIPHVRE